MPEETPASFVPERGPSPEARASTPDEFKSGVKPDWCPSCGDYAVLSALEKACRELALQPKDILTVSGIGCSSNLPGFFATYGIHSLHGRAMAVATGAKLANPELTVIVTGGDGDGYGIGIGHFIHAMRRNLDVTYIVMNNQIYGLTTGQASPTTEAGAKTKSTPEGAIERPVNPPALALVSGATFVARAFSGDPAHMAETVKRAISHKGFSLVDCFSPCVTFNHYNTYQWFRPRVYRLDGSGYDPSDYKSALDKAHEGPEKIPIGVFYREEGKPTYEDVEPTLSRHGAPVKRRLGLTPEEGRALIEEFL